MKTGSELVSFSNINHLNNSYTDLPSIAVGEILTLNNTIEEEDEEMLELEDEEIMKSENIIHRFHNF